uniref:ARAD1B07304p n=1 Tax=Blastobotrys adeninivorans TaxID=409370 RepID=A0A060T539_BLAAD
MDRMDHIPLDDVNQRQRAGMAGSEHHPSSLRNEYSAGNGSDGQGRYNPYYNGSGPGTNNPTHGGGESSSSNTDTVGDDHDDGRLELRPELSYQREPSITQRARSIFSSRSNGSGGRRSGSIRRSNDTHHEPGNPYDPRASQEKQVEFEGTDDQKPLPTVLEEPSDEEDEDLPVISEVVNDFEEAQYDQKNQARRRGHKQLEEKRKPKKKKKRDENSRVGRFIRFARHVWINILSQNLYTRLFIYWFPLALILFIPLAVGAWGKHNATLGGVRLQWIFIWLEIVWGSMFVCRVVSHLAAPAFEILVGIVHPAWRKYGTVIRAMENALNLVLWALVSMITFMPVMTQNPHAQPGDTAGTQEWMRVINNIMVALLICSLVYFAERLLIHFLSVSFHKTRFAKRIKKNKLEIRVLGQLLHASYVVFPEFSPEFEQEDITLESGSLLAKGGNLQVGFARKIAKNQNVQKAVGTLNRVVGSAANIFQNVGRDLRGESQLSNNAHKTVIDALGTKELSEVLGRRIWMSLVLEGADELSVDDLVDVLGESYRADATAVFEVLDQDGNGALTLDEMVQSCKDIGRERKTIYRSLRDMDQAIGKLHSLLMFVVLIICIIIFIGMLAPSVSAVLATLGTSILALSFVFSATAQEVLASCVFLFVKHPLDVGDLVQVAHPTGSTMMVVKEISLMHTVLQFLSTGMITQASNATLNTIFIDNITRSGPMSTPFNLTLGLPETTAEDIDELRRRIDIFLEENSRDFLGGPYYQIVDYPDLDRITFCINITFKSNQEDALLYGIRRTKVIQFLAQCVNEIPLHLPRREENYTDPTMPMLVSHPNDLPWAKRDSDNPFIEPTPHRRNPTGMRPQVVDVTEEVLNQETNTTEQVTEKQPLDLDDRNISSPPPALNTGVSSGAEVRRAGSIMSRTSRMSLARARTTGRRRRNSQTTQATEDIASPTNARAPDFY